MNIYNKYYDLIILIKIKKATLQILTKFMTVAGFCINLQETRRGAQDASEQKTMRPVKLFLA